jgi:hypothetical protein
MNTESESDPTNEQRGYAQPAQPESCPTPKAIGRRHTFSPNAKAEARPATPTHRAFDERHTLALLVGRLTEFCEGTDETPPCPELKPVIRSLRKKMDALDLDRDDKDAPKTAPVNDDKANH